MSCKAGHILNYDGHCRICGEWLVDVDGPLSPFPRKEEDNDHPRPDTEQGLHDHQQHRDP